MKTSKLIFYFSLIVLLWSCTKENNDPLNESDPAGSEPNLIVKLKFDSNQERLNNLGEVSIVPVGNATQSPSIKSMSANYIELSPDANTLLGNGEIIYQGSETTDGGGLAIDFQNAILAGDSETFLTIPLSQLSVGNYNWVRVSLAYQEGDINFLADDGNDYTGTLASFVGYNNYITEFDLNGSTIVVNNNVLQGFWAFESSGFSMQGQAPVGATTVPNPLFNTSPVPQGSCVVTGEFENSLAITGEETEDIEVTLSFSTNQSFEWTEVNADGKYEPSAGEQVVDMGLRGLMPITSN